MINLSAGWRLMCEVFCVSPGTVQSCTDILKRGHILAISPGESSCTDILKKGHNLAISPGESRHCTELY